MEKEQDMEYKKLRTSDLNISVVGFGAWGIGGAPFWTNEGDEKSAGAILKAYDLGVNFFDTAPVYGFGHSEELLGKTLKPVRDKVLLATKCGLRWGDGGLSSIRKDCTRKSILKEVDESLKRLDTDWIDLYQVHWPDIETPQEETMEALLEIQEKKKIRFIGVSNYSVDQMKEIMKFGKIVFLQPEYSLLQRSIENEIAPFCRESGIGIIAYSPLASGVLTGKYDKSTKFTDWRSKGIIGTFSGEEYEKNIDKVDRLKKVAQSAGKTCAQMAINWVAGRPEVSTALLGFKNEKHVEENLAAVGWRLDPDHEKEIEEIFAV
ncbi:MAG: aldo/keto reductase [Nitrospinota bacterium]|nr:aldo/keto reductase [Nitrospinota bacterium]